MDTTVAATEKVKVPFWRSTWCAAIIVGISGFLAPGEPKARFGREFTY